jgi:hypothetical protein
MRQTIRTLAVSTLLVAAPLLVLVATAAPRARF